MINEWYSGRHDFDSSSRLVDKRTQFNVGPIRKTYLALAISILVEDGKIATIDDEIIEYLKDLDKNIAN